MHLSLKGKQWATTPSPCLSHLGPPLTSRDNTASDTTGTGIHHHGAVETGSGEVQWIACHWIICNNYIWVPVRQVHYLLFSYGWPGYIQIRRQWLMPPELHYSEKMAEFRYALSRKDGRLVHLDEFSDPIPFSQVCRFANIFLLHLILWILLKNILIVLG